MVRPAGTSPVRGAGTGAEVLVRHCPGACALPPLGPSAQRRRDGMIGGNAVALWLRLASRQSRKKAGRQAYAHRPEGTGQAPTPRVPTPSLWEETSKACLNVYKIPISR